MEPEKKPNGAVIGLIIIVVILIMGGVYIWQSQVKNVVENKDTTPVTTSDTNDLDSLGKELESTDVNVDVDVNSIN